MPHLMKSVNQLIEELRTFPLDALVLTYVEWDETDQASDAYIPQPSPVWDEEQGAVVL
jgi:hypothetical protein